MGQSIAKVNSAQEVYSNFSKVQTMDHPSMGHVIIIKDKRSNGLYFLKKREYESNDAQTTFNLIFDRSSIAHNNLLRLFGYLRVEDTDLAHEFTNNAPGIALILEYAPHDLKEEVMKRTRIGKTFPEPEIWYLINSVATVCAYLQEQNIHHGDLRPRTVLLSDEGKVKIFDEILVNLQQRRFRENALYSPQALEYFARGAAAYDVFKSDVFSFGMSILEISTMVDVHNWCYDLAAKQLKFQVIDSLLEKVRTTYSEKLFCLLVAMLQFDERQRITWSQVNQYLQGQITLPNPFQNMMTQKTAGQTGQIPSQPQAGVPPASLTPLRMRPSAGPQNQPNIVPQERTRSFTPNPTGRNDYFLAPFLLPNTAQTATHSPISMQKTSLLRAAKPQGPAASTEYYLLPEAQGGYPNLQSNLQSQGNLLVPPSAQAQGQVPTGASGDLSALRQTTFLQRTPTRTTMNPIQPNFPQSQPAPQQPQPVLQQHGQSKFLNQRLISPHMNQMPSQGTLNQKQSFFFTSGEKQMLQQQQQQHGQPMMIPQYPQAQPVQQPQQQPANPMGVTAQQPFYPGPMQDMAANQQTRLSYYGFHRSVNEPMPYNYSTFPEDNKGYSTNERPGGEGQNLQGKVSTCKVSSPAYLVTRNISSPTSGQMQQTTLFMTSPTGTMPFDAQANNVMGNNPATNTNSNTKNILKTNQNFQNKIVTSAGPKATNPVGTTNQFAGVIGQGPSTAKNASTTAPKKTILKHGQQTTSDNKFSTTTRANLKTSVNLQTFSSRHGTVAMQPQAQK